MEKKILIIDENTEVSYFEMLSDKSDKCIVIVHGLAEHKGRYVEFINKLHLLNFSVFALDLIGHGESCGARGDVKNFNVFIDELEKFISFIKKNHPKMKIVLFGHSLGGLVASCYASKYNNVDLLVLSNPLLEKRKWLNIFYLLPYKLLSFVKIKKRHSESKAMLQYSRQDPLACKYMTLRLLGEIFVSGIRCAKKGLKKVKVPLLLLGGKDDRLVDTSSFPRLINDFGSEDKTLKIYEGVRHRLVHSARKDEIINDISLWINKRT